MCAVIGQLEFIITAIKHAAYVTHVLYGGNNVRCLRHKFQRARFLKHFIKEVKNLSSCIVDYISTWEFLRTLEKCEKHSAAPRASLYTSLMFLKISACLYNSTMHSGAFFISLRSHIRNTGMDSISVLLTSHEHRIPEAFA